MGKPLAGQNTLKNEVWKKWLLIILIFLPAIAIRYLQPLKFPVLNWDEGLWNLGAKHTLLLGDPTAFNFGHIFLSPLHYVSSLLVYALFSPTLIFSRWLSATFGVGAIIFTYLLGKCIGGKQIGLIAALFCAYNSILILFSRWGVLELEVCFYMVAASYFWFHTNDRKVWFSALFIAGALLVKANALALLPALVIGQFFLVGSESSEKLSIIKRVSVVQWLSFIAGIIIALLGYFCISRVNPQLFLDTWNAHSADRVSTVITSNSLYSVSMLRSTLRFVKEFFSHFPVMFILSIIGVVLSIIRSKRYIYFLAGWPVFTYLLISVQSMKSCHYYYPTIPAFTILAAIGLYELSAMISNKSIQQNIYTYWTITF